jgi:hypothetical protein
MNPRRLLTFVALGLGLAGRAGAQEGRWEVAGEGRYVARYEGHIVRGSVPFALEATLDADGHYEIVGPACPSGDGSPPVFSGRWTRGSDGFLRAVVRDAIRANVIGCGGGRGVRVRGLRVRQRLAPDARSVTGKFAAGVRYRFVVGRERETVRARVHGDYTGSRVDP